MGPKMAQRPISHSFTYKNQDFDKPFCILMGLLEKMMGPSILNRHLTAKLTSNLNSLCMGPNQKIKQIKSISTGFLTKQLGPIPEISLALSPMFCSNVRQNHISDSEVGYTSYSLRFLLQWSAATKKQI